MPPRTRKAAWAVFSGQTSGKIDISVNGLLSCDSTCPKAGLVEISVDASASGSWSYGGGTAAGSILGQADVHIGLGGLGFDCSMQQPGAPGSAMSPSIQ